MDRPSLLTGAETLAVSSAAAPAATIAAAYLVDRLGAPFPPWFLLAVFVAAAIVTFLKLRPHTEWRADELTVFLAVVFTICVWLLWIASPWLLPLGSGSDLTHHILLIQYIETHWRLVHDPAAEKFLGEMASYTPGSHILAAAAGAWSGTDGLRALHPVVACTVALKSGFVFLIARRAIGGAVSGSSSSARIARLALASTAVALLFVSKVYFLRSFIENSFVAQVAGELFAMVMWWSLAVWDIGSLSALVFATAGVAAFLTWPVWMGPPVVVASALALFSKERTFAERTWQLALAAGPIALVGLLYFAARPGGVAMAGTSGAAPWPQVSTYGLWFLVLSGAGLVIACARRDSAIVTLLAGAILLQSAALYVVAGGPGAQSPYMALKMFYLLIYPQSVAAAITVAEVWRVITAAAPLRWRQPAGAVLACVAAAAIALPVGRTLRRAPQSLTTLKHPAVSEPLERAGLWAREHVPVSCVEYLVDLDETAYWLHLAVLGNPRLTPRSLDPDTYEPDLAVVRWLSPGGLQYGIADFATLARGVREELDVLQQFDNAAVVKRRGPSSCPAEP